MKYLMLSMLVVLVLLTTACSPQAAPATAPATTAPATEAPLLYPRPVEQLSILERTIRSARSWSMTKA